VATFCHQLTHEQNPQVQNDKSIPLIYVNSLAETIISCIREKRNDRKYNVPFETEIKVSEILAQLNIFKTEYLEKNMIPSLHSEFEIALFNTFRSYIASNHFPVKLVKHEDQRGYLAVTMQEKTGGQSFYSITNPGITRGNHYHRNKIERFCVVKGKASIKIRKIGTGVITEYIVSGEEPATVDMPVWHTHNLTNIGNDDLVALFWSHQIFEKTDNDTFFEIV
jgi:UDP-2-acetamido-2,6-beta-L-arabino-hexul-4-ose reductase